MIQELDYCNIVIVYHFERGEELYFRQRVQETAPDQAVCYCVSNVIYANGIISDAVKIPFNLLEKKKLKLYVGKLRQEWGYEPQCGFYHLMIQFGQEQTILSATEQGYVLINRDGTIKDCKSISMYQYYNVDVLIEAMFTRLEEVERLELNRKLLLTC